MLLSKVKLERFKAAFRPDPIALQKFNVVIGRNGSGKSTLLEALQWLDDTIRYDARHACDRYFGSEDLINFRSRTNLSFFSLELHWSKQNPDFTWHYNLLVENKNAVPSIYSEKLDYINKKKIKTTFIDTDKNKQRTIKLNDDSNTQFPMREPDRLALSRITGQVDSSLTISPAFLHSFWSNAVFLRLSPNRLAMGSPSTRKSFEPILDEEGQMLPSLLNELNVRQRKELVTNLREILSGMRGVKVTGAEIGRDSRVHYQLLEQMPYKGRAGKGLFEIPAWMLSEGTRRITAILALLVHDPLPSLLCIEEIENGLDPWTVRKILNHLQSASDRGTQVIITTHSPWVLDSVPLDSIIHVRRTGGSTEYLKFSEQEEVKKFNPNIPAGTRYTNISEAR